MVNMTEEAKKISKRSCVNPMNRTSQLVNLIRNPVRHAIKMTMKCPDIIVTGPDTESIKITRAQGMTHLLKAAVDSIAAETIKDVLQKKKQNRQKMRVKQKEKKLIKLAAEAFMPKAFKNPKNLKGTKAPNNSNASIQMLRMPKTPNTNSSKSMRLETPNISNMPSIMLDKPRRMAWQQ